MGHRIYQRHFGVKGSALRAWIAATAACVLLAGCGTKLAGSAITADGVKIPESVITTQANEVQAEIEKLPAGSVTQIPSLVDLSQMTVNRLVVALLLEKAVADKGLTVSADEVKQFQEQVFATYGKETIVAQVATQNGVSSANLSSFMKAIVTENKLAALLDPTGTQDSQTKALVGYLGDLGRSIHVTVAPRFGEWNPNTLQVLVGDTSLSQSAPSPLPTAAQ